WSSHWRGYGIRNEVFRFHRLGVVAINLSAEASPARQEAASSNRVDSRSFLRPRHHADSHLARCVGDQRSTGPRSSAQEAVGAGNDKFRARHFAATRDNRIMKRSVVFSALLFGALLIPACSRKPAQSGPAAPEVLITTVVPKDVPRVLERVATLDGFINANINAQVQGYIISRDYQEGSIVKKGDLLFQIDPRPFEAALAQARGTQAKDQANWAKAD